MLDPVEHNFNIYLGQTLAYPFNVFNDEEQIDPYDFTDCTVSAQARIAHDSSKAINLNPSIDGNSIILNATPTQLSQIIIPSNSKSIKLVYDIEVTKPDLTKWTIVRGVIDAYPEVTKI